MVKSDVFFRSPPSQFSKAPLCSELKVHSVGIVEVPFPKAMDVRSKGHWRKGVCVCVSVWMCCEVCDEVSGEACVDVF